MQTDVTTGSERPLLALCSQMHML